MAANDGDFNGLVAVVTGGASGIGRAAAEELHSRGARVIVLDRDQADLGPHIHAATVDVGDSDGIEAAIDGVAARWGRLDVLVNCAGIEARGNVEDLADDEALHLLDVNVMGVLRTMRSAIPHLKRSPHGAIVNTSSVSAVRGMAGLALYSASKGAVLAMTRAIAADLLPFGSGPTACHLARSTPPGSAASWPRRARQRPPSRHWSPDSRWAVWSKPRKWPPQSPTWPAPWRRLSLGRRWISTGDLFRCPWPPT